MYCTCNERAGPHETTLRHRSHRAANCRLCIPQTPNFSAHHAPNPRFGTRESARRAAFFLTVQPTLAALLLALSMAPIRWHAVPSAQSVAFTMLLCSRCQVEADDACATSDRYASTYGGFVWLPRQLTSRCGTSIGQSEKGTRSVTPAIWAPQLASPRVCCSYGTYTGTDAWLYRQTKNMPEAVASALIAILSLADTA